MLSTSSSNSESLLKAANTHPWLGWPTFGRTREHPSQRRKRLSNFSLGIPSGLNNSEMMEITSVPDAPDDIIEDEDGVGGGLMPDAIPTQVGTRRTLSLLLLAEAVGSSTLSGNERSGSA